MAEEDGTDNVERRIGALRIIEEPEARLTYLGDGRWSYGVDDRPITSSVEDLLNSTPLPEGMDDEAKDDSSESSVRFRKEEPSRSTVDASEKSDFFCLEVGEESKKGLAFVAFKFIKKYPFSYVGKANQGEVEAYFKVHLLSKYVWDFFYLHDPNGNKDPLFLVPSVQFEHFLKFMNSETKMKLAIPGGEARTKFFLTFGDSDTPMPKFLGRVHTEEAYEDLRSRMYSLPKANLRELSPAALQSFKKTMDRAYRTLASKKKSPEAAKVKKIERQKEDGRMTKRVQRYLGLRARAAYASHSASAAAGWNVEKPAPFITDSSVRFVCVDVEAYEKNANIVTEIGLSVLDTDDIMDIPPGEDGKNWFPLIKTFHIRISEYSYIRNTEYVDGCPLSFTFGKSELIPLGEAAQRVGSIIGDSGSEDQRPVILVGHGIKNDLNYLSKIGYNVWNVPQIQDEVDTSKMYRRLERAQNERGLEAVCSELGWPGCDFHNAGNDAHYTLRSMIIIAFQQMLDPKGESRSAQGPKLEEYVM